MQNKIINFIVKEYKIDKRANEILEFDRLHECEVFEEIDEWYGSRAYVYNQCFVCASNS